MKNVEQIKAFGRSSECFLILFYQYFDSKVYIDHLSYFYRFLILYDIRLRNIKVPAGKLTF